MPDIPRDALARFAEVAERYERAFAQVQDLLRQAEHGRLPSWVFAIDGVRLEALAAVSPELAEAERDRRAWRTALHALAEHIALGGDAVALDDGAPDQRDDAHLQKLDRFISIVNAAKEGGCIYVDGRFQPVVAR